MSSPTSFDSDRPLPPDSSAQTPADALPETPEIVPENEDDARLVELFLTVRRGANWFYWIAALSLVNSVIMLMGGNVHFVIGLGVTAIIDAVASAIGEENADIATITKLGAFAMDLVVAGVVVLFGWLANRRITAIFALGMALYLMDGLIFVLFQDWMSVGFHAFALFCMWSGFSAVRELNRLERGFHLSAAT